jgi:hypothetical protein
MPVSQSPPRPLPAALRRALERELAHNLSMAREYDDLIADIPDALPLGGVRTIVQTGHSDGGCSAGSTNSTAA